MDYNERMQILKQIENLQMNVASLGLRLNEAEKKLGLAPKKDDKPSVFKRMFAKKEKVDFLEP